MRSLVVCSLLAVASVARAQAPLVITNANLVDGVRGAFASNASVVIENGRIARIATGPVTPPAGAQVIDARGRYLLPGLIDVHTHVASLAAARRALESGVTTIRSASVNAFQDVALREASRQGAIPGPDVLAAGVFVTPNLGETILADTALPALAGGVTTEAALRAVVRANARRGVDVIKTRGTERAGLPDTDPRKQTYTEQQLAWIVDEATRHNLPVMAHAHGDEGAYAAVKAGVRSIEHGTYLSDSTLRLMKERGTWLVPTWITILDLATPGGDYEDPVLTLRGRNMSPIVAAAVAKAHRMGIRIATGADTDYGTASVNRIYAEVALFVDAGMTPLEALRTATTSAAELLRIGDRVGQLKEGYEADLILVEGNPLADIKALSDALVVISNGRVGLNRTPFGK
ncbi:MAG: amidohydrolase family protein [Gemmatimonadetes bacterium]|nr:amidohydrolase family protein [Gemmatimonadota bacterium]